MCDNVVTVSGDPILHRICSEYLEMPGLRLTIAQAQRLWGLDERTCTQILQSLTEQQFLCCLHDATYARVTGGGQIPRTANDQGQASALMASDENVAAG